MYPCCAPFLLFVILFVFPQSSDSQGEEYYRACTAPKRFECGSFADDISFPFRVEDGRPDYCSHPGYKITCAKDSPEIQIGSKTYRVTGPIDYGNRLLTVVEKQFADYGYCPVHSEDDSLPRPPDDLFGLANPAFNITLYYNCSEAFDYPALQKVPCLPNNDDSMNYYTTVPPRVLPAGMNEKCRVSILPVLPSAFSPLAGNQMKITEAVEEGFQMYWLAGVGWCQRCRTDGGLCGSHPSDPAKPACFCSDESQYPDCLRAPRSGTKARKTLKIIIGLSAGAGVAGLGLLLAISVFMIKKRMFPERLLFWRNAPSISRKVEAFLEKYGPLSPKRYKYADIKKITTSFKDKLGQGGFGGVYKGKLADGSLVAVKLLSETKGDGEEFMNEVASIGRISHVNIVTLMGFCSEGSKRALVYEFMPNGSLEKFIYTDSKAPESLHLGWEKLYQITVGIAKGLEYLHRGCTTRILHFDIKPHNILLDRDFCPKISDFGMAKLCPTRDSIISMLGTRGTVGYIAPEVFSRNFGGVSHKSDVYSYGMMVLEMVGGRRNINAEVDNTSEIYFPDWIYKRLDHLSLSLLLDEEIATKEELVKMRKMILVGIWCIQTNPANRPSMSRVLEMLEGSLEAIQIPPKPYFSSPPRLPDQLASANTSTQ